MDLRLLIIFLFQSPKLDDAVECPIGNCRHCSTIDECSVCNMGWFGQTCEYQCRGSRSTCSMCSDSFLRKKSSLVNEKHCFGCQGNEYFSVDECRDCPQNCEKCNGLNDCKECKAGYFGHSCQNECPTNCKSCISATSCRTCKDQWLGDSCQCGPNCLQIGNTSEWCSLNGTCTEGCLKGKMGRKCGLDCKNKCVECDQFSNRCLRCVNGWYGTNCNKKCEHCSPGNMGEDIACDIESGKCINGCANGFFGSYCDKQCSPMCHDQLQNIHRCDNETSLCIFGCIPGLYGGNCDVNCSINCSNKTCYQSSGQCKNGCIQGWYGLNCTDACSKSCLYGSCNATSGYCDIGCEPGWYGAICKESCHIKCANKSCDRLSGLCGNEGILEEFRIRNTTYSQSCIGNCKNNTCDRHTSLCFLGCEVGYEGTYCNKTVLSDVGATVVLASYGIACTLIVLSFFLFVCFAIRYTLCQMSRRHRHIHIFKRDDRDPIYDEIRNNGDEMSIIRNCTDDNVHCETIADTALDIASCYTRSPRKGGYKSTLIDTKDRYFEYTDLTYLKQSRSCLPRLPPRNESPDASYDVIKDVVQTIEETDSVFLKDIHNENYSTKVVINEEQLNKEVNPRSTDIDLDLMKAEGKLSSEMNSDGCDYIHPIC